MLSILNKYTVRLAPRLTRRTTMFVKDPLDQLILDPQGWGWTQPEHRCNCSYCYQGRRR